MTDNHIEEEEAFARDLFDTSDQDFTRNLVANSDETPPPAAGTTDGDLLHHLFNTDH